MPIKPLVIPAQAGIHLHRNLDSRLRGNGRGIRTQAGFTLIEMVVFMIVISIGLAALLAVYNRSVTNSVDPITRIRLLELCQSQLDEVIARKYDENSPTGGVPACGSSETGAATCDGTIGTESGELQTNTASLDDVDDFHNYSDAPYPGYSRSVAVTFAGGELGLASAQAKRITVTVTAPTGESITLSSYRTNF